MSGLDWERNMFTGAISPARLRKSVISVPPLARRADLALDEAQNRRLLDHLRAGGVTTYLYGGNANLYNMGVTEFGALLDMLERLTAADDWIIPSIGADYGKACDQIDLLKDRAFPTAMVLPLRFPATTKGAARGIGLLAERYSKPVIAYVKDEGYIEPADLAALVKDGSVCAIKYAIVRSDPTQDAVLTTLLKSVDPAIVVSGIGERPVPVHTGAFGLKAFTSGSVCVAPRLSTAILRAVAAGDPATIAALREHFIPLEDLRDQHSPLRVLHEAVRLAGIAETGPMLPFLSNIDAPEILRPIEAAARRLREADAALAAAA
jgi:dihydrodipicolinate synthase/N-acetylneuraminate lyase